MYVPKRTPGAHHVASLQSNFTGCHIYVESGKDCKFWRFFVEKSKVRLHACNGWQYVVETIKKEVAKGVNCLGIIDNDFRRLFQYDDDLPENIFTTDDHDIEMMALKTDASKRVITIFDASDKIQSFEKTEGDIMEFVYGISDSIGLLKFINMRYGLNMVFKKEGKDQIIELPKYESFLDKTCHYLSDNNMITYLFSWSSSQRKRPNKTVEEIKDLFDDEKTNNYDTMQLSCGHDACYILAYILKKHIANRNVSQKEVEDLLYCSYTIDYLKKTQLYNNLEEWSREKGIKIFTN